MLKPALQLRLGQQLTMTPQLQQAIRLLQLPALELQQTIREALEQNVMLEADDDGDLLPEPTDAGADASPDATPTEATTDEPAAGEPDVDVVVDPWDQG